jgi:beta-glucanase (GH16 family)
MKNTLTLLMYFAGILFCFNAATQTPNLVWSDEFTGTSLDESKWSYQIGDGCAEGICGWGNNELQSYQKANVILSDGKLHITARKQRVQNKSYTSGRIRTINKGDWTYGRFEALINLPAGGGLWPAFWMMPTNNVYGGWPKSGEIDIMEMVGWNPDKTLGYIHYGEVWPNNQSQGATFAKHSGQFPGNYHEFAVEWEPGIIRWFVDGYLFQTKTAADVAPYHWPFDQDFYIILNVAVGGNLGGSVDDLALPATMSVEYVRVYDGFKPYISGNRIVMHKAMGTTYHIGNVPSSTKVSWTVPSGATIVSGQGTPTVTIDWGTTSGDVIASVPTGSGNQTLKVDVFVEPAYIRDFSFQNFDNPALITLKSADGQLTVVDNPLPSTLNPSAKSGRYVRNETKRWDVLAYNLNKSIANAGAYVNKDRKFYMDILTSAPVGTDIIIQLESSTATTSNYPTGRHSRYIGRHTRNGVWERVEFNPLDRPDGTVPDTDVTGMVLLFATDSYSGDTYFWDNFDSYKIDESGGGIIAVTGVSVSPSSATLHVNQTVQLSATVSPSNATNTSVTWSSSNTSVATVSTTGLVTGKAAGTAVITVTTSDGEYKASSTITVLSSAGQDQPMTNTLNLATSTKGPNTTAIARIDVSSSGAPVGAASVTVTWSGSFTGTSTGSTDGNGRVVFETPGIRNAGAFGVTVDNITRTGYSWDVANSQTYAATTKSAEVLVNNMSSGELFLYPSPARGDKITLEFNQNMNLELQVYSSTGQIVILQQVTGESIDLNIGHLPRGNYFIRATHENMVISGKFIRD